MRTIAKLLIEFKGTNVENGLENLIKILISGSATTLNLGNCNEFCENHFDFEISKIQKYSKTKAEVDLIIPPCLDGSDYGFPHLLSSINYYSVFSEVKSYQLLDLQLSSSFLENIKGPRYGIEGIRKLFNIYSRPLVGMILKPRQKIDINNIIKYVNMALKGGVDYIIDDELVINPYCSPMNKRITHINNILRMHFETTGHQSYYFINATAEISESIEIIKKGLDANIKGFSLNAISMGYAAVKYIIDYFKGDCIFILNNIGRGVLTRKSNFYISDEVSCLISRIIGGDAIYTGPLTNAFYFDESNLKNKIQKLQSNLSHINKSFAISSGNINKRDIIGNEEVMGNNIMIQMGGAIFDEPNKSIDNLKKIIKILEIESEEKTKSFKAMNTNINVFSTRIKKIYKNIENDYKLIGENEDLLRYENRAKEKARIENEILETKKSVIKNLIELENISTQNNSERSKLLELIEESDIIEEVDFSESDYKHFISSVIKISQSLEKLSNDKLKEKMKLIEAETKLSSKFKLTIPIIPLLFSYETELSADFKIELSKIWKNFLFKIKSKI